LFSCLKQLIPDEEIFEDYFHPMLFWGNGQPPSSLSSQFFKIPHRKEGCS
jgi:hypothetical protein